MFAFLRQKRQNEVRACIHGILNNSVPRRTNPVDQRVEPRYNRSVAVIQIPWDGEPLIDHAVYGLVQNLSDRGARIIAQKPILVDQVLCAFAVDQVRFLLGSVRQASPLGGGFWQCGVKFTDLINGSDHPSLEELNSLYAGLSPHAPAGETALQSA
jgi:hypothetical protein